MRQRSSSAIPKFDKSSHAKDTALPLSSTVLNLSMLLPRSLLPLTVALVALFVGSAAAQTDSSSSAASSVSGDSESDTSTSSAKLEGWYSCSEVTFSSQFPDDATTSLLTNAQCATFKAPLCYQGVCKDPTNKQVDIFVKRIKGSSFSSSNPNIIFMQGGPGAASPAMEDAMSSISALLNGDVNVYTMDHRGTGRSTKLDCVAAQAQTSGSPGGSSINAAEVGSCAAELESKYGSDLASFSVTSAASDLKFFITNFLQGQQTFVYGVSYGTALVERLIHLEPKGVAGYILDGIATSSGSAKKNFEYFSTWDPDYDQVAQYFLSFCATSRLDCGAYFPENSVADTLKTLMGNLDTDSYKCSAPLDMMLAKLYGYETGQFTPGTGFRSVLGSLLGRASMRKFIPVLTYRLTRCNSDDIKVVNHFFNMMGESESGFAEEDLFSSDLVYKIIVYSEFWETPTPTTEEMLGRFMNTTVSSGSFSEVETYCVFSKEDSPACKDFQEYSNYKASPILYKKDKYWNVAASPPKDVSVLLMSSKMDPQTPHKYAEFLYKALDTKNKELITFEHATHATLWTTPAFEGSTSFTCGMQVVGSYIANGGDLTAMDQSCVSSMPEVSFLLNSAYTEQLLNATTPFEGSYTGTEEEAAAMKPIVKKQDSGDATGAAGTSSSEEDDGKTSYLAVFLVFAALFAIATIATVVFVVKWRRAKNQQHNQNGGVYEASTA